jgi:hypothetical protein
VAVAALLLLISVAAGLARLLSRDDQNAEAASSPSPKTTPSASSSTTGSVIQGPTVPTGLLGASYKDAEHLLKEAGFKVERSDVDSDAPKDIVVDVSPPQGSEVTEGDPVTLFVSRGSKEAPAKEHGKDEGHKPPGKAKGKKH